MGKEKANEKKKKNNFQKTIQLLILKSVNFSFKGFFNIL